MKILYLDCFSGFDLNKMLGAIIDLGVSEQLIEHELKSMGFECRIFASVVERKGVEAKLAAVSCEGKALNYKEAMAIVDTVSNTRIKNRMAKVVDIIADEDNETELEYIDMITLLAALTAEHFIETQKCVISPVNAGGDKTVNAILKKAEIDIVKDGMSTTDKLGAAYLSAFASEISAFCSYDTVKVGYGAGEADFETPNVLRAVIAQDGDFSQIEALYKSTIEEFSVI